MMDQEWNNKVRRAASRLALHARQITGGHCSLSGGDYDSEITTEHLDLLRKAVDDYDQVIIEFARENIIEKPTTESYRKKPITVQAFRFTLDAEHPHWFDKLIQEGQVWFQGGDEPYCTIETLEGEMKAQEGDYIICGVKGEVYPCKPDIFAMTYEPVAPSPEQKGGE